MTLSFGPIEPSATPPVTARIALLWTSDDGLQRSVGCLEKHETDGAVSYAWSLPLVACSDKEEVLSAVVAACSTDTLPSGNPVPHA